MADVNRARHIDYLSSGKPKVVYLDPFTCRDPGDYPGRHIEYVRTGDHAGFPKVASTDLCCDAYCADGTDCFQEKACYPTGPGITGVVLVYFLEVNCLYAGNPYPLYYDAGTHTWTNTFALSGGTVKLTFSCNGGLADNDPAKFRMAWEVTCGYDHFSAFVDAGYFCPAPLRIQFNPSSDPSIKNCCCNPLAGALTLGSMVVVANCTPEVFGRHVDYVRTGPNTGIPLVARSLVSCSTPVTGACCLGTIPQCVCGTISNVNITSLGSCTADNPCWALIYEFCCVVDDPLYPGVTSYAMSGFVCADVPGCQNCRFAVKCEDDGSGGSVWTAAGSSAGCTVGVISFSCDPFELVLHIGVSGLGTYTLTIHEC